MREGEGECYLSRREAGVKCTSDGTTSGRPWVQRGRVR